jgi:hypothetical protein
VADVVRPGDVVVTMGIGDVYLLCPDILELIALRAADRASAGAAAPEAGEIS